LFGIHVPSIKTSLKDYFNNAGNTQLTQYKIYLDLVYEVTVNPNDIRYQPPRYWEEILHQTKFINHFYKFIGNGDIEANYKVPLLRLAEMYLIMIENLPVSEAASYYKTFREARALDLETETTSMVSDEAKMARVEKEYRKDFYGEGQMFFFYKRLNYSSVTLPTYFTLSADEYVLPKPKKQIEFE
jgi:hypothetical protein